MLFQVDGSPKVHGIQEAARQFKLNQIRKSRVGKQTNKYTTFPISIHQIPLTIGGPIDYTTEGKGTMKIKFLSNNIIATI